MRINAIGRGLRRGLVWGLVWVLALLVAAAPWASWAEGAGGSGASGGAAPSHLTVGPLLTAPLGYGDRRVQFSWRLAEGMQAAYQLQCAKTPAGLLDGAVDLWDSGRVDSGQSTFVDYGGPTLGSRQAVYWRVRVWPAGRDQPTAWSDPARLELGLLEADDWQAQWISWPQQDPVKPDPAAYFRREWALDKPVKHARLHVSALGTSAWWINGRRVGEDHFTPGWADPRQRVLTRVFDVTAHLQAGVNAIAGIAADGWHSGQILFAKPDRFGGVPKLLGQLEITHPDGSVTTIKTDGSWAVSTGPIRMADHYEGETYDARLELKDAAGRRWTQPGYDAAAWGQAKAEPKDPAIALTPAAHQPVRVIQEVWPVTIQRTGPGKYLVDFGQNLVGWVKLAVPMAAGQTVTIRHAEALDPDGTIHTKNLRAADATDRYTAAQDGVQHWRPSFTFHGFRYAELTFSQAQDETQGQWPHPNMGWAVAQVLHNDMPRTGEWSSDHPGLNQLYQNTVWGQKGNFLEAPTDCPQRNERLGWTGDAQVFAPTATFNYNVLAFFEKWCQDLRDSQADNGGVQWAAPWPGELKDDISPRGVSPAWGDAAVIVPMAIYDRYGYRRILEDNFDMMLRWVRFYERFTADTDGVYTGGGFGDWLQPYQRGNDGWKGDTPLGLIGTAYFARSADLTARAAAVLNRQEAAEMARVFLNAKQAFAQTYFLADGTLNPKTVPLPTQTAYLLALAFDLLPEAQRAGAFEALVGLIEIEAQGHLRTGFVGTPLICPTLHRFGRSDLAYRLLLNESYPSWLYSVSQGATTIWERWNSYTLKDGFNGTRMNSLNHYAYGAVCDWMVTSVAGLSSGDGYRHLVFAPLVDGPMQEARAVYDTPYGLAHSSWRAFDKPAGRRVVFSCSVPPNSRGVIRLPNTPEEWVGPGEHTRSVVLTDP